MVDPGVGWPKPDCPAPPGIGLAPGFGPAPIALAPGPPGLENPGAPFMFAAGVPITPAFGLATGTCLV